MTICLVTAEYPPMVGGLADYTQHLASVLCRAGQEVTVLTSRGASGPRSSPIAVAAAHSGPDAPPIQVQAVVSQWDFGAFPAIARALDQARPSIVHIQYQTAAYGMHPAITLLPRWLQWRRQGLSCVTTLHDLRDPYLFPKAGPVRRWVTHQLIRRSHGIITTNQEDAATVDAILGNGQPDRARLTPQVSLIPIGSNILPSPEETVDAAIVRRALSIPEHAYVVGHFGLLNHTKGLESLFKAIRVLLDEGLPLVLVMVGEEIGASDPTNRAYREQLLQLARSLALEPHVRWTGYLPPPELSRTLRALDCCLLPYTDGASYRRGSLMAALAHGLPVVTTTPKAAASPSGATQESLPALKDRHHCRLVPADDPLRLAEATRELLRDPLLRRCLASGARSLAAAFSWDEIALRTASFYQDVIARRGGWA